MPQNEGILRSRTLNKPVFLKGILDETDYSVCESVFVAMITEFNIEMASSPIFKDEIANINFFYDISFSYVQELVIFS